MRFVLKKIMPIVEKTLGIVRLALGLGPNQYINFRNQQQLQPNPSEMLLQSIEFPNEEHHKKVNEVDEANSSTSQKKVRFMVESRLYWFLAQMFFDDKTVESMRKRVFKKENNQNSKCLVEETIQIDEECKVKSIDNNIVPTEDDEWEVVSYDDAGDCSEEYFVTESIENGDDFDANVIVPALKDLELQSTISVPDIKELETEANVAVPALQKLEYQPNNSIPALKGALECTENAAVVDLKETESETITAVPALEESECQSNKTSHVELFVPAGEIIIETTKSEHSNVNDADNKKKVNVKISLVAEETINLNVVSEEKRDNSGHIEPPTGKRDDSILKLAI